MISFYSIPTFLAAMAFFFTGWFVMSKNWKATLNRAFGTVCFILFIWTMSVSVTYSTQNPVVAKFFAVFTCMDIAVVPPTYYWLVAEILKLRKEQKWVILTFMITLVQLPLFLFTDLIILAEPHHYFYGYYSSAGPWHPAHLVIWYGIMARPFYLMFKTFLKVRKDYSVEANRKKYLVLAFIVVCFCSIDFVPKYGIEYYPFGFMFGVLFAVIIAYGIFKYQIMDIRLAINRTGIFIGIYTLVGGLPFLISFFGQELMSQWLGGRWWTIPLGVSTSLAGLSPFILSRVWHHSEAALIKKLEQKEEEAATDDLTGLLVRRVFIERATPILRRARRVKQSCCLMMVDLDHFKEKNDRYGHLIGDFVIMETVQRLKKVFRQEDLIGRYGGDEIIIFVPFTQKKQAVEIARRLRRHVSVMPIRTNDGDLKQTISIGLAISSPEDADIESLIVKADKALYTAKERGRDCVVVSSAR